MSRGKKQCVRQDEKLVELLSSNIEDASCKVLQLCEELAETIVKRKVVSKTSVGANLQIARGQDTCINSNVIGPVDLHSTQAVAKVPPEHWCSNDSIESSTILPSTAFTAMGRGRARKRPFPPAAVENFVVNAPISTFPSTVQADWRGIEARGRSAGLKLASGHRPLRESPESSETCLLGYMHRLDTVGPEARTWICARTNALSIQAYKQMH